MDINTVLSILALVAAVASFIVSVIAFRFQRKAKVSELRNEYLASVVDLQMMVQETSRILSEAKQYESDAYEQYRIHERLDKENTNYNNWEKVYSDWSRNKDIKSIDELNMLINASRKERQSIEKYHNFIRGYLDRVKSADKIKSNKAN